MASSSSFVNLLASQGSVDLDSAETPLFSTQSLQESSVKERRKWSVKEDLILIGVWLNTSKDSIVGNEQKVPRELGQCKQRWARINDLVCKFAGCYDTALREQRSGQNDNDVMKAALDIFNSDQNIKFNLEHAWRELRHDVKWCSTYLEKDKDKRKTTDTPVAELEDRPIGVKASKAAGSVEDMCEMKTRDGLPNMEDEVDRRLNAALDKAVDEYFEDTYNNIVKNQTKKQSKRAYVERNREEGHTRLWNDYFSENPTFPPHLFRRRFRMNKAVFMRIVDRLSENFSFFQQRRDAVGRLGLSPLQKCTAALHMLAYGCAADAVDEYLRLGESTSLSRHFTRSSSKEGIYPKWSTFIQSISNPQGPEAYLFAKVQEATRKDVERAFGVLQARFAIVKNPAILWDKRQIGMVMRTCIILHNMIVENERNGYTQYDTSEFEEGDSSRSSQVDMSYSPKPSNLRTMLDIRSRVRDPHIHG
uniref:Myb-like domain-containing protein n=1 Tax=Brassica oleracea var. oleracea TaxID=109376 RepID=A0A0D3ADM6_BRAOL